MTPATSRRWRPSAALLIVSLWIGYGVVGLGDHGLTYDEPALLYAGDRTLFWLLHPGVEHGLDLLGPWPPGFTTPFAHFPGTDDPRHYPVLPGLVSALASRVFHDGLGWLDATDGHHLGLVLLQAVGLWLFCRWATRVLGRVGGVAATVALALYPCSIGHGFNNAKDWPCAVFSAVALLAAGAGFIENRARPLLMSGVLFGVALSCKMNAVFGLVVLALWTPFALMLLFRRRRRMSAAVVAAAFGVPYLAGGFFFALWPWLYQGQGIAGSWRRLSEYVVFMLDFGSGDRAWWTAYPLRAVFFMTPPLLSIAALAGIVLAARRVARTNGATDIAGRFQARERLAIVLLLLLSGGLPVLRIAAPHSNFYDANRHFMEYIPALCALAGLGVAEMVRALPRALERSRWWPKLTAVAEGPWARRAAWPMTVVAAVAALLWPILEYRPYETTYFNMFIGGLGGAQRAGIFKIASPRQGLANGTEGDYWLSSQRAGVRAAKSADPSAPLALCTPTAHLSPDSPDVKEVRPRFVGLDDPSAFVFLSPRELLCPWATLRTLEAKRPVVKRVKRGGGLVWELLGPASGATFPVSTPANPYTL